MVFCVYFIDAGMLPIHCFDSRVQGINDNDVFDSRNLGMDQTVAVYEGMDL